MGAGEGLPVAEIWQRRGRCLPWALAQETVCTAGPWQEIGELIMNRANTFWTRSVPELRAECEACHPSHLL